MVKKNVIIACITCLIAGRVLAGIGENMDASPAESPLISASYYPGISGSRGIVIKICGVNLVDQYMGSFHVMYSSSSDEEFGVMATTETATKYRYFFLNVDSTNLDAVTLAVTYFYASGEGKLHQVSRIVEINLSELLPSNVSKLLALNDIVESAECPL